MAHGYSLSWETEAGGLRCTRILSLKKKIPCQLTDTQANKPQTRAVQIVRKALKTVKSMGLIRQLLIEEADGRHE